HNPLHRLRLHSSNCARYSLPLGFRLQRRQLTGKLTSRLDQAATPCRKLFLSQGSVPRRRTDGRSRVAEPTTTTSQGGLGMRKFLLSTCFGALAVFAGGGASANDELMKMSQNPQDWVMPTGDSANQSYSKLNHIHPSHI